MAVFGGGFARSAAVPFGRIPPELAPGIRRLEATEPDHGEPRVRFEHRVPPLPRLSLRRLLGRYRRRLLAVGAIVVAETLLLQAGPLLTQVAIDHGILAGSEAVLALAAGLYLVTVLTGAVASGARVRWTGRLAAAVMTDLRVLVFAHIQRLSMGYFTREPAGVIMTRMTADIEALQQLLQDGLAQLALQLLTMAFVTVVLFTYDVELALITFALVLPALVGLSLWFRSASERGYGRVRERLATVIADLAENLHGMRVVAAHNRQRHNVLHHRNLSGDYRAAFDHTAQVVGAYTGLTAGIGVLGQAALLAIGGHMVLRGQLSVGELTAFILYVGALFLPIQQLVAVYNLHMQGQVALGKLRELLAERPDVEEAAEAVELPPIEGEIRLEHVDFAYEAGVPVLHDVDLLIRPGETTAFVGATGAGKSTVAKLITRFYDPTAGRVLIDGHDLRDVTLDSLRRQLGVVPQEPFLFAGTLRDNIAYGAPDASEERVRRAVDLVGLGDLVERSPGGLDAVVHERGQSLSSGERQLLALARAFMVQPRVLVLDEATSNLDGRSEARVETALDVLLEGRTAILIAHRLSTAMRADRIVVIDDGRVAETGTHEELIAAGGRYAALYGAWVREGR